ncbi:MAG: TetR/AcrR family transcriptional regulator [Polyangiaceae bacterium]|nr:TetR/AcrR family transcriptional regulator [Polyangiaceae bacterium]
MALRRDGQDRRDALLDAALACFAKRGVVHTGIEEIRKAAGASPSSVYHLFGGLPALTLALLERTFVRLFEHLSARVVPQPSAEKAIKALVVGHVDWVLAQRDEARFMYEATALEMDAEASAALQRKKAEMIAPMAARFASFMKKGELYRMSPLELDVIVLGSTHEACRRWLAGAPIEPRFLRSVLPVLAWQAVQKAPKKSARKS